jgi:hypothetical protein
VEICLLRRGPQDLPASTLLLGIALLAHAVMSSLIAAVYYASGTSVLFGLTDTALLVFLVGATLTFQRLQSRLVQTLSAFAGAGAILQLVALPLTAWLVATRQAGQGTHGAELILYALTGWSWAISAHILRHALGIRFGPAFALAIVFFLIALNILPGLFPDPLAQSGTRGQLVAPGTTLR